VARTGKKNCDDALIIALASGSSYPAAAQKAEVALRTVYRRMEDETFRRRVEEARNDLVSQAVGRLSAIADCACQTLADLLDPESEASDQVRLSAARVALDSLFRGHELDNLTRQVRDLTRRLEEAERARTQGLHPEAASESGQPPDADPESSPDAPEGGPEPDHERGGETPGPLAEEPPPLF
jgi:uncharacterized membrane protein YccC